MRDVSSRVFEMSLSFGSVRRVIREVRLATVDVWGVLVRLMTMGRMSTSVPSQCWRMALARGVYFFRESCVRCGRGCGKCNIFIPLSEYF
jgi:hypothetical protein